MTRHSAAKELGFPNSTALNINTLQDLTTHVRRLMDSFPAPWAIAGGWALDLFLAQQTRSHSDLEIAIFRNDQHQLHHHFQGWTFTKVSENQRQAWPINQSLALPIHEIHARDEQNQLEFLLNEQADGHWLYRRNSAVTLPLDQAILVSKSGLPLLAPQIVLLFKSKLPRPKDETDLKSALDSLSTFQRQWLRQQLGICHSGHPWLRLI